MAYLRNFQAFNKASAEMSDIQHSISGEKKIFLYGLDLHGELCIAECDIKTLKLDMMYLPEYRLKMTWRSIVAKCAKKEL